MSNFLAALAQTIVGTAAAATAAQAQQKAARSAKKRPGCTPCAVNARVMDAKARAGFSPGGGA